jgi:hypothetical protein
MLRTSLVLASIVVPVGIGFALTSFFWPRVKPFRFDLLALKLSLAIGIGFGQASCIFFICLIVFGAAGKGFVLVECAALIAVVGFLIFKAVAKKHESSSQTVSDLQAGSTRPWVLLTTFCIAFVLGLARFVLLTMKSPHGDWDAWAIWNMRARFLFKSGERWRDAFSTILERSNPDYPLLLSTTIAGCWIYIGDETLIIPSLVAMLFTVGTIGLLVGGLSVLRDTSQAFLAGIILASTPFFLRHGTSQYADIPIGYFFLGTFMLLALHDVLSKKDSNFLILAGTAAGLSAWTKNEGLLFIATVSVGRFVAVVPSKGLRSYFAQMLSFAKGLIPVLAVIIYFKVVLAPASYLTARQEFVTTVEKFFDPSRHLQVWKAIANRILDFGNWSVSVPLLLVFYLLLLGAKVTGKEKSAVVTTGIALCLLFLGYSIIFVITPLDLAFHLSTSVDRLLLQLWPSFIFLFFMTARPVGEVLGSHTSSFRGDYAKQ